MLYRASPFHASCQLASAFEAQAEIGKGVENLNRDETTSALDSDYLKAALGECAR